jgi:hypothetical protein
MPQSQVQLYRDDLLSETLKLYIMSHTPDFGLKFEEGFGIRNPLSAIGIMYPFPRSGVGTTAVLARSDSYRQVISEETTSTPIITEVIRMGNFFLTKNEYLLNFRRQLRLKKGGEKS